MNIDDPKLTAYALGELTGEERRAVEAAIDQEPRLRAFVEETQAFASLLSREYHAEQTPAGLAPAQRLEVVGQAASARKTARFSSRRMAWGASIAALAAALAVAPFLPWSQTLVGRPKLAKQTAGEESGRQVTVGVPSAAGDKIAEVPAAGAKPVPPALPSGPALSPLAAATPPAVPMEAPQVALAQHAPITPDFTGSAQAPSAEPAKFQTAQLSPKQLANIKQFTASWAKRGGDSAGLGSAPSEKTCEVIRTRSATAPVFMPPSILAPAPSAANVAPASASKPAFNTESYAAFAENTFREVMQEPLSTFSIDVDTASYSNVRRFLNTGQRPPANAVRIEELINYFHYDYPQPKGDAPFSVNVETAQCPWEPRHRLVRIGLKGREIGAAKRPASNLVFLIDVSGSMDADNKLPLLKASLCQLVEQLGENDTVAIVVYAGSTGVALPPTRGHQKEAILKAIDSLRANGSTNGAGGIQLAYQAAVENLIPEGTNRVILATDGDFNVGITSDAELVRLIEEKRKSGVYLTVLGFGEGNLNDSMMKKLASHGNGNYAYIDSLREGRKVLVRQIAGTLVTIAKDVKIQVEFNPRAAGSYRLVGYESRLLAKEDFNNDKKDAGEIGAGHTVTALYEVVPAGSKTPGTVDPLKYQPEKRATPPPAAAGDGPASKEMLTVKLRYKNPSEETSRLIEEAVSDRDAAIGQSSPDFRFAAAVAEFGMLLRGSAQSGSASWEQVSALAAGAKGSDESGYRAEFLELVEKAKGRP